MNKNYSGLSSVGNEIISSNSQSQKNILSSAGKNNKLIVKTYKLTKDSSVQDISNNNILNTKSQSSLNLSNIKYKDGYIIKDAVNSNPGFGLWSIKPSTEDNIKKIEKENDTKIIKKEESKNIVDKISNNKVLFNDKELNNYKYSKFCDEDIKQNKKNKKMMEKLNNKIKDLEKKYMNALANYHEKKAICENKIKEKRAIEQMINNNKAEIELIKQRTKEMDSENTIVEQYLINTKKEIERLLNVIKEDEKNMTKLNIEFEQRIKKENEEKIKLREKIKENEEKILLLQEQNKNILTTNTFFANEETNSESKKDFEIKKLKEMILNLQIKISGLKKEINTNNKEKQKLDKILQYKNIKDEYQKLNISNLFLAVEENERNEQRKNDILKSQNEIIKNLNEQIRIKYNIVTNKKMKKSFSQGMLINK